MSPLRSINGFSHIYVGGATGPFDLALLLLILATIAIVFLWDENYGEETSSSSMSTMFDSASRTWTLLFTNFHLLVIGLAVAAFEGSMNVFVFNWTPALENSFLPEGLAFSLFMMSCMCGSAVFALLNPDGNPTRVLLVTLVAASLSFLAVKYPVGNIPVFASFMTFEFCVGLYFPAMGTLKSAAVPESLRASVYNAYRAPLNLIVCGLLLTDISLSTTFVICCMLLIVALIGLGAYEHTAGTNILGETTPLAPRGRSHRKQGCQK